LLIPDIGGNEINKVRSTYDAMHKLGHELGELEPDVLVMISPHADLYRDAFSIRGDTVLEGSFANFGCPQVRISKQNDLELAAALTQTAVEQGLPLQELTGGFSRSEQLDHGLLVPLYYLDQYMETPVVVLSISGLDYSSHFQLGRIAKDVCEALARTAVFVASGDLSHRLIRGAPAGYSPKGKDFDRRIEEIATSGDFDALYDIDESLVAEAGECGFRSIHTMWGALKNELLQNTVLSYEGPFGVGYLVSRHVKTG
jgi:aromatic ring-opening dioxygenase LigB subunit